MDQLASLPEGVRKVALDRFRQIQPEREENRPCSPLREKRAYHIEPRSDGLRNIGVLA
jgi:hypothetical protein